MQRIPMPPQDRGLSHGRTGEQWRPLSVAHSRRLRCLRGRRRKVWRHVTRRRHPRRLRSPSAAHRLTARLTWHQPLEATGKTGVGSWTEQGFGLRPQCGTSQFPLSGPANEREPCRFAIPCKSRLGGLRTPPRRKRAALNQRLPDMFQGTSSCMFESGRVSTASVAENYAKLRAKT